MGRFIVEDLLKTGKHKVTAISRPDSTNKFASGIEIKHVDYDDPSSIVEALRGQDVLIITMAVTAPQDTEKKLLEAAAAAGVPWVLPNEWGFDAGGDADLATDTLIREQKKATRAMVEKMGRSWWIALVCGFWYEFSLAGQPERYGFDFKNRKVTLFDEGTAPINTSTWEQCGRAVASLLSLKVLPDDEHDESLCLSKFKNAPVYISSFHVSQRDMLDSVIRVTGTSEKDWQVSHEDSKQRYQDGHNELKQGNMMGFAKLLYTRIFYPDGTGSFQSRVTLHNDGLGLPKEDLDTCTKKAVQMAEKSDYKFMRIDDGI